MGSIFSPQQPTGATTPHPRQDTYQGMTLSLWMRDEIVPMEPYPSPAQRDWKDKSLTFWSALICGEDLLCLNQLLPAKWSALAAIGLGKLMNRFWLLAVQTFADGRGKLVASRLRGAEVF